MAARTGIPSLRQQEQTRAAIQTTQLVKRLQCFALAEKDDAGNEVELDAGRLKAIEVLLRKSLPDLSSVSLTGDPDNPVVVQRIERVVVDPANSDS
jgi:hypothetical protein